MAFLISRLCEKALINFSLRESRNIFQRVSGIPGIYDVNARSVRTNFPRNVALPKAATEQVYMEDEKEDSSISKEIITNVNQQIKNDSHGRLFAVIQVMGKQFKVTNEDIIVLLVGASDFTVIGRPLVSPSLVNVEGTVIEKALSHTKTRFRKQRRKQYRRIKFYRSELTMLRINTVEFKGLLNEHKDVEGTEGRIF
ncbi:hypothetical protein J437_LFUL006429 [Ladona fulva]|uniref:Large ribosomal subunit protein bL21m n=1 Tax=Ladona fulva TaxID=123851 RepID=A0A8K0NYX0_LADFU|nr:hypothetical protein J437_LFUL006429 [Ladona fulva]